MTFRHCGSFKAGDAVPDWLLDVEPREDGAASPALARPVIAFTIDCHVVETSLGYFVVPDSMPFPSIINVTGTDDGAASIFAPAKPVTLPISFQIMHPDGWDRDGEDAPSPISPLVMVG